MGLSLLTRRLDVAADRDGRPDYWNPALAFGLGGLLATLLPLAMFMIRAQIYKEQRTLALLIIAGGATLTAAAVFLLARWVMIRFRGFFVWQAILLAAVLVTIAWGGDRLSGWLYPGSFSRVEQQLTGCLNGTPYDLDHAVVSTRLGSGVMEIAPLTGAAPALRVGPAQAWTFTDLVGEDTESRKALRQYGC